MDGGPPLVDSPPTNADALCRIAESYLARGPTPVKGAERHHVIVHVDAAALSRDGPGRSQLADGPAIAPEVARRLGCDASLSVDRQAGPQGALGGEKDESDPGGDRSRPPRARSRMPLSGLRANSLRRCAPRPPLGAWWRDLARQSRPALPPSPPPRPRGRVHGPTRAPRLGVPRPTGRPARSRPAATANRPRRASAPQPPRRARDPRRHPADRHRREDEPALGGGCSPGDLRSALTRRRPG